MPLVGFRKENLPKAQLIRNGPTDVVLVIAHCLPPRIPTRVYPTGPVLEPNPNPPFPRTDLPE